MNEIRIIGGSGEDCFIEGGDKHGFIFAQLKWDGCLHLYLKGAVEEGKEAWTQEGRAENDCDYLHLCDPINTLSMLLDFLKTARTKFRESDNWLGEEGHE